MSIRVRFSSNEFGPEEVHAASRAFANLADTTDAISVQSAQGGVVRPGERSGGFEIATLVMDLVTSGAVTAVINLLQLHFARNSEITTIFEAPDGRKLTVSAKNMAPDQIVATTDALREVFEAAT